MNKGLTNGLIKIIISGGEFPRNFKEKLSDNVSIDKVDLGITLESKNDKGSIVSYRESEIESILNNDKGTADLVKKLGLEEEIRRIEEFNDFRPREKFYKIMELLGPGGIRTSAPNHNDFLKSLKDADKYDKILIVPISKKLSATYNAAKLAVDRLNQQHQTDSSFKNKISIVDPGLATYLLGIYAYNLIVNNFEGSMDSVNYSPNILSQNNLYFSSLIYNIKYIETGGRASHILINFTSKVLNLFKRKVWITLEGGKVKLIKVLGNKREFGEKILSEFKRFNSDKRYETGVALLYTGREMKEKLLHIGEELKKLNVTYEIESVDIGVGVHLGPEAIAVGVYKF